MSDCGGLVMHSWRRLALFLALSAAAGLGLVWTLYRPSASRPEPDQQDGPQWFEDVTEKSGLDFIHDAGPTDSFFMPQALGSGAALFDFNGDGKLDIYLLHNGGPNGKKNQLFQQEEGGRFRDVSKDSGLDVAGYGMGVAIGDVNNDGRPDVLITEY